MACNHIRIEIRTALGQNDRVKEYGRLGHLCLLQILCSAVKHYLCNVESEDLICPVKHLTCSGIGLIELFCHSREL